MKCLGENGRGGGLASCLGGSSNTPSCFMQGNQDYKLKATAQMQTSPNYLQPLSLNNLDCCCNKLYEHVTHR